MSTAATNQLSSIETYSQPRANIILLGTGQVGGELLRILENKPRRDIQLQAVANSCQSYHSENGIAPHEVEALLASSDKGNDPARYAELLLASNDGAPIIVDATASEEIARWHDVWLARGIHVVTANKIAAANGWADEGRSPSTTVLYGDAATVGAGLPILSTLRRLQNAGDHITRIEGVLSGSLAYIFHALQCGRSFSDSLQAATDAGFTEPDPRTDLSGEDVARKLSILARVADLHTKQELHAQSVLPDAVMRADKETFAQHLPVLDAVWQQRVRAAHKKDKVLRYLACADAVEGASIGVRSISRDNPLAQTRGADNIVCIHSEAYCDEPLVISGAGAGPLVTARALLADIGEVLLRCK